MCVAERFDLECRASSFVPGPKWVSAPPRSTGLDSGLRRNDGLSESAGLDSGSLLAETFE